MTKRKRHLPVGMGVERKGIIERLTWIGLLLGWYLYLLVFAGIGKALGGDYGMLMGIMVGFIVQFIVIGGNGEV